MQMKSHVVTHMKVRRPFRMLSMACGVLAACYLAAFLWYFEIFSAPVRDNEHRWLGPVIRGNSHIVDIGKVYYFEGTNIFLYRTFHPLCSVWLWVVGF